MKIVLIAIACITLTAFSSPKTTTDYSNVTALTEVSFASFSLINDTKEKVSIHTGRGFVSLNKGSKTSISCSSGKEVRWAESGKKKGVIFKITSDMCGKTIKLSEFL